MKQNQPLVSVPVITYNSSATVIETLDSVFNQTYPNIELIVSDDCSTDDTIELCRNWIEKNKGRFVGAKILTVEKNSGTSANCNRAEDACKGEWVKEIAGDDVLLPNCITDFVEYVQEHPESVYVFARIKVFGASEEECQRYEKEVFDPAFFQLTSEQQLEKLIFDRNYIPSATCFYNRQKKDECGVRNDERIPLLEDWPKWINLLKAGVKFNFVDKVLVKYRISGISTTGLYSDVYYRTCRLFKYYYLYPEWMLKNQDEAIRRMVDEDYCEYIDLRDSLIGVRESKAYRLGKFILRPFSWMKRTIIGKK